MSQTSIIFGALLIGFVVYVTLKGELAAYANILFGASPSNAGVLGAQAPANTAAPSNLFGGNAAFLSGVSIP